MTQRRYYSEYTDGLIDFGISTCSTGDATMRDQMNCQEAIGSFVSVFKNWGPNNGAITDFLKNTGPYTIGCALLHMKDPQFINTNYGWGCPTTTGASLSGASTLAAPLSGFLGAALFALLLLLLQHNVR